MLKIRNFLAVIAFFTTTFLSMQVNAQNPIAFASDEHAQYDKTLITSSDLGLYNLGNILKTFVKPNACDFLGLVGDQVRKGTIPPQIPTQNELDNKKKDFSAVTTLVSTTYSTYLIATEGNHDIVASTYNNGTGWTNCPSPFVDLFVIPSSEFKNTGLLGQLDYFLLNRSRYRDGKLVVIMSHFPLHTFKDDVYAPDGSAETQIFNTIELYTDPAKCAKPLDVIFIYGHTHDSPWGNGIKPLAKPNETMLLAGSTYDNTIHHINVTKKLHFTYLNAGYMNIPGNTKQYGEVSIISTLRTNKSTFTIKKFKITDPTKTPVTFTSTTTTLTRVDTNYNLWQ